jgi:hypothetical protein
MPGSARSSASSASSSISVIFLYILRCSYRHDLDGAKLLFDEDGDVIVPSKESETVTQEFEWLTIVHALETPMDDVGLQVS